MRQLYHCSRFDYSKSFLLSLQGRSFVGFTAVLLHFHSIQYLTVADAMTVGSITPVFVTLVAHACLGEKCGVFPIFAAVLTITGVGIIARPPLLTGADHFDIDVLVSRYCLYIFEAFETNQYTFV